jgi:hypothetical protein
MKTIWNRSSSRQLLWMLLLLCMSSWGAADFILRSFDPAVPRADRAPALIFDLISGPGTTTCEGVRADIAPVISRDGNTLMVILPMVRVSIFSPGCQSTIFTVRDARWQFAEPLPAGQFTVRFFGGFSFLGSTVPDFFLGELPLTVLEPLSVPALNFGGLALLVLLIFGFAAYATRHTPHT